MTEELDRLKAATRKYNRDKERLDVSKQDVVAAALDALRAGERPIDVANASPFTGAYIRRLADAQGIEPAKTGPKPPRT